MRVIYLCLFLQFNYATQLLYSLVNLCEAYPLDSILDTMDMTCRH